MLRAKECASTPSPSIVFTFGLAIESIKEFGGASNKFIKIKFVPLNSRLFAS
jgi:hypothetical protein